ncbi:hypothetical protein V6N13_019695 [Hibiscus sabdariffa]
MRSWPILLLFVCSRFDALAMEQDKTDVAQPVVLDMDISEVHKSTNVAKGKSVSHFVAESSSKGGLRPVVFASREEVNKETPGVTPIPHVHTGKDIVVAVVSGEKIISREVWSLV